jgi:hypothetical protein
MNRHLNWRRLGLLIRNDFLEGMRGYLTAFTVITIIIMLNAIPSAGYGELKEDYYNDAFAFMLLLWGSIHVSIIFKELSDKRLNESYLLLPASTLEKTLARYLHGSVFFIFYVLVYTTLISLLTEGLNQLLFERSNSLFNPFSNEVWQLIGVFMVIQPVFFLGAAWFRRARWFKTVLSLFIVLFCLALLAVVSCFIFFGADMQGIMLIGMPGADHDGGLNWQVNDELFGYIVTGLKVLCFAVAPPFCCYLTWLRVRETQVSHGV